MLLQKKVLNLLPNLSAEMLDFDHLGGHSFQNLSSRFFLIICDDSVVSLDILMLQKPETNNDG